MTRETLDAKQLHALEEVERYRDESAEATRVKTHTTRKFHEWITKARDLGVPPVVIAESADLTPARVTQIAPRTTPVPPRSQAQKKVSADSRVNVPEAVPTIAGAAAATGNGLSGVVTARKRTPYGKPTMFYRDGYGRTDDGRAVYLGWPDHDNSIGGILRTCEIAWVGFEGAVRVYVTGEAPALAHGEATQAEAVREWALDVRGVNGDALAHWSSQSHYLDSPTLPVLRFKSTTGMRVTIMRAASWWGETDANPDTCADAWRGLEAALGNVQVFRGTGLADTPSTTGRALWQRTIPEGRSYPVMSGELRDLIASTSGQGRTELLPPAADKVPNFTYLDGRFMYGSLCWGLPVGEPTFWTGEQIEKLDPREWTKTIRGRGRFRITMKVPDGWDHVGLFMAPADDRRAGWCYPSEPGQVFTTWVDGCELWTAADRGWDPVIHEGFTWAEGKPLDLWIGKLLDLWRAAAAHQENSAAQLAAKAVRQIVVTSIGGFATRRHNKTRTAPLDQAPDVPAGTEVRRVGDSLVWDEPGRLSGWAEELSHPEWSATIWARARVRLLAGRGVDNTQVGALYLPREQVIGFATDALYLATDPGWADDGGAGRFRVKGRLDKPEPWPETHAELWGLRDKAEAAL